MCGGLSDLPETTLPDDLRIEFRGYTKEEADAIGSKLLGILHAYGRYLSLEGLDGVTIGADYREALASVDRGCPQMNAHPEPTEDETFGIGVAMALPVLRAGVTKTHLVFGPKIVVDLSSEIASEETQETLDIIAHELGHVVDHEQKSRAFGGYLFRRLEELIPDPLDQYLWELSHHVWDEYFASRISGSLGSRGILESELFRSARDAYKARIREARIPYHRREIDLDAFLAVVKQCLRNVLLATGYALGIRDANEDRNEIDSSLLKLLGEPESMELVAFHSSLLTLWRRRGEWASYDEFLILNGPTLALLHTLELFPRLVEGGHLYMDVPIRL